MNTRRAWLMGVAWLAMVGAGGVWGSAPADRGREPDAVRADPAAGSGQPDADVMRKWSRSCALCHVDGNARAPRVGVAEEWQPRLEKGMDVLLDHTINGFNKMPPLGYCMSCEAEDFRSLIEFMAGARP